MISQDPRDLARPKSGPKKHEPGERNKEQIVRIVVLRDRCGVHFAGHQPDARGRADVVDNLTPSHRDWVRFVRLCDAAGEGVRRVRLLMRFAVTVPVLSRSARRVMYDDVEVGRLPASEATLKGVEGWMFDRLPRSTR